MAEDIKQQQANNKQTPTQEAPKVEETKKPVVEETQAPVVEQIVEEEVIVQTPPTKPVKEPVVVPKPQAPTQVEPTSIDNVIDVKIYGEGFVSTLNAYAPASERLTRGVVIDVLQEGFRVFRVTKDKEEELTIEWTDKGPWLIIKK